jgi:quercetin dioxygenase-like cupin family protein
LEKARARVARTLIKDGPVRIVLIGVRPGGALAEHTAEGPITIQVLEGSLELEAAGNRTTLGVGMLLHLRGGVPHAVTSAEGAFFLLTVLQSANA